MAEKLLLTISLLCSGRPETKKSLDSLKTLRERVRSELILVDTGCDEEMRKLLYAYADEVISFKWCNDFAKARNAGLERAQGQWFMFLDDDERFIDTKAIEEFFYQENINTMAMQNISQEIIWIKRGKIMKTTGRRGWHV